MATNILDKVGSIGSVIAGAAVPCCFPFLSLFGSILGLSILARYERWILYVMQGLVVLAFVGSIIAYRGHKKIMPLIVSALSVAAILYGLNTDLDIRYIYSGMVGLLVVSLWNSIEARRCKTQC